MGFDQVEIVLRPTSIEEAWTQLMERGDAARFMGGGIDLALFAPRSVKTLIDLADVPLSGIDEDSSGLRIGATTTMTEAIESPQLSSYAKGFLRDVLRQVAAPLQRNLATFGGTLASGHPWSDVVPALLILDAELTIYDGSERRLSLESFYGERAASGRSLIRAIHLPPIPEGGRGAFVSFTRTAFDVGMLNVACFGSVADRRWASVRIAVGGTPGLGTRLRSVETLLTDQAPSEEGISQAAEAASAAIDARDDRRASASYRRKLTARLVARCLREIGGLSKGGAR